MFVSFYPKKARQIGGFLVYHLQNNIFCRIRMNPCNTGHNFFIRKWKTRFCNLALINSFFSSLNLANTCPAKSSSTSVWYFDSSICKLWKECLFQVCRKLFHDISWNIEECNTWHNYFSTSIRIKSGSPFSLISNTGVSDLKVWSSPFSSLVS